MPDIYIIYSYMALLMGITCTLVATTLTIFRSRRIIDTAFTAREWLLACLFMTQFVATYGPPDTTVDIFHANAGSVRVMFMGFLLSASLFALCALLYNFHWRIRSNGVLLKEDSNE